ncbi:MAG: hypothetical protein MJ180_03010 [Candidatus Gastranaerophilales bacterium]|nr:hypothetical protein [Candidatus Gastranaerophilales bacterium]
MSYEIPVKSFKSEIRGINFDSINYQSSNSLAFLKSENGITKSLLALEILFNIPKNYSPVLKNYWGEIINNMLEWFKAAQELPCDIIGLKFNITEEKEIDKAVETLKDICKIANKPLLITGSNKKDLDGLLLPRLAEIPSKPCIIGIAEEETYKSITKIVSKKGHYIIARTPIDINLAKELNILLTEENVSPDKILIDTNMAALGYGLDYGYSIMERVKLAGLDGDEMLNMPIIAFVGEEEWKAKEARVADFDENYGVFDERALAWESSTATAIMLAGANILVIWHPDVIKELKSFMEEE